MSALTEAEKADGWKLMPGDWIVVRRRLSWSTNNFFEPGQIDTVKPKTLMVKIGSGRRLSRVSIDDVVPVQDEAAARLFCERAESAKAASVERETKAHDAYKTAIGKLIHASVEASK